MPNLKILNASWYDLTKIKTPQKDTSIIIDNIHVPADIYYQVEPEVICPVQNYLLSNYSRYKYILTFNETILEKCPNAKLMIYGTKWLHPNEYNNLPDKKYLLTTIVGNKLMTKSQYYRHIVYNIQELIKIPKIFYRSKDSLQTLKDFGNNPILKDDNKFNMLKESQFHIAIENCRVKYYFSEKLCDAILTKNIPIYYGCTNIHEYFDTTGWIILETMDYNEILQKISIIDENYYNKYIDVINKNFEKVNEYIDLNKTLSKVLDSIDDY